jgi:SAM-dependent methyltransferase
VMSWKKRQCPWGGPDRLPALDLGCGGGAHAMFIAENGFEVTAMDSSREALHQTEKNCLRRGLDDYVRYVEMDYIANPIAWQHYHCPSVTLDWLSLAHAPAEHAERVMREHLFHLQRMGIYIVGLFGKATSPATFEGRPPCPLWTRGGVEGIAQVIVKDAPGCKYRIEEQAYTRNGDLTQIFCLVFSKD